MSTYWLKLDLLSDTLFGRGDGLAGVVDDEVQHDAAGLPYLSGKTIKGMMGAICAEILFALEQAEKKADWEQNAQRLFGAPGSTLADIALLHVGNAQLPSDLRLAVAEDVQNNHLTRQAVLDSLTSMRRQTAMDAVTGAPKQESLRTIRVVQRNLPFCARLELNEDKANKEADLALLAACVKAFRRVGTNRNRGLGRIKADLYDTDPFQSEAKPKTEDYFQHFKEEVLR